MENLVIWVNGKKRLEEEIRKLEEECAAKLAELQAEATRLEETLNKRRNEIRGAVIKELGEHLVLNIQKYGKNSINNIKDELIFLKDISDLETITK